jgi:hypothetical protein
MRAYVWLGRRDPRAGHYKSGFGLNSLLVSLGPEVLAGVLREGERRPEQRRRPT